MKISALYLSILFSFIFSENINAQNPAGVRVSARAFLQGALIESLIGPSLMRDDLRKLKLLPVSEPYTGTKRYQHVGPGGAEAILNEQVFEVSGMDAIVDWLYLELRSGDDPTKVVATRSALLQRDGDVVDMDGTSSVFFEETLPGAYHLAIRHRNHLGAMSEEAILFDETPTAVDFSASNFPTHGEYAQVQMGGVKALWAGDVNQDGRSIVQGAGSDSFEVFLAVLSAADNATGNSNHILEGYLSADIDLDGQAIYSGTGSDRGILFSEVYGKAIELFGSTAIPTAFFKEKLPE